jgi:hypothetical protein
VQLQLQRIQHKTGDFMVQATKVSKPYKFDKEMQAKFCDCIAHGLRISQAAKSCGINRSTYLDYYSSDPEFKRAVDEAEEAATDVIENALFEAAAGGDVKAQQVWLFNRRKHAWSDSKNLKVDANVQATNQFILRWPEQIVHGEEDEDDGDNPADVVPEADAGSEGPT